MGEAAPGPAVRSELALRVVSSLVLALFALVATYLGGWVFAAVWLVAAGAILIEWIGMSGRAPLWILTGVACAAVIAVVPPLVREHPQLGIVGILWMFAVVWGTDIAAYFAGRRFGGPKLAPSVSPKKTWSGFAGGLVAGTLAGTLLAVVARRFGWTAPVGLPVILMFSAIASVLAQLGDLGESALKRRFGAKDSGRLIPGHGGVMDRLDGFWAVAALMGVVLAATQGLRSGDGAG
jgi:phosphatidate cytidylyltransferase